MIFDSIYKLEEAKAKKNKCRNASIRESSRNEKNRKKEMVANLRKAPKGGRINIMHNMIKQLKQLGKDKRQDLNL